MNYQTWTLADERVLADLYPDTTNAAIAAAMSRTAIGVKQKAKTLKLRKSAEYMAALIRFRIAKTGRPAIVRHEFLAQVSSLMDRPIGARMADMLSVVGGKRGRIKSIVSCCIGIGAMHRVGKAQLMRYFRTAEAAQAGVQAIADYRLATERSRVANAPRKAARALARAERERLKALAQASMPPKPPRSPKVKAARAPRVRPPKPVKVAAPKKAMPAGRRALSRSQKSAKRWDDRPVVIPDHIRVVRGPCNLDRRYTVHTVAEPYFSAQQPGQYRGEARAWVPR